MIFLLMFIWLLPQYYWSNISSPLYRINKNIEILLRQIWSADFLTSMKLTEPLINTAKRYVKELDIWSYNIEEMHTSRTLRDLYTSIECVINTIWNSSILLFIQKTYIISIMLLEILTNNMSDNLQVSWIWLAISDVIYVCMLFVITCHCNILLKLEPQYIEVSWKQSMRPVLYLDLWWYLLMRIFKQWT